MKDDSIEVYVRSLHGRILHVVVLLNELQHAWKWALFPGCLPSWRGRALAGGACMGSKLPGSSTEYREDLRTYILMYVYIKESFTNQKYDWCGTAGPGTKGAGCTLHGSQWSQEWDTRHVHEHRYFLWLGDSKGTRESSYLKTCSIVHSLYHFNSPVGSECEWRIGAPSVRATSCVWTGPSCTAKHPTSNCLLPVVRAVHITEVCCHGNH